MPDIPKIAPKFGFVAGNICIRRHIMSNYADWLPKTRAGQIAMAENWREVLSGMPASWGIPQAEVTTFLTLTSAARAALTLATSSEKTVVVTERCKAAFKALIAKMRFFKKHYFLVPPLTEADMAALGLRVSVPHHTPKPKPEDHVAFSLSVDAQDHGVRADYQIAGSEHHSKRPYHGAEVYYWVLPLDAPAPVAADHPGARSEIDTATPWVKSFLGADIGKRLYVMMRWENASVGKKSANPENSKGPWSVIQSVVIA
jgi:hypothetical protein